MVEKVKLPIEGHEKDRAYIRLVLDDLKKKGFTADIIAEVLSAPIKRVSLLLLRARFRR